MLFGRIRFSELPRRSLLYCVLCVLKTCSRVLRAYVLTCLACLRANWQLVFCAHVQKVSTGLFSIHQLIKEKLHPRFCSNPRHILDLELHDSFNQAARYGSRTYATSKIELFVTLSSKVRPKLLECSSAYPRP